MLTRRRVLQDSFAAALGVGCTMYADQPVTATKRTCFLPRLVNVDLLAEESAQGFQSLLPATQFLQADSIRGRVGLGTVIILPAVRSLPTDYIRELRKCVNGGAWVIWERAANFGGHSEYHARELLAHFFGICISDPIRRSSTYIRYRWPIKCSAGGFHDSVRLECLPDEVIAECAGEPVAMKRAIGKGGLVFLGTMLGPGIRAEEREARVIGQTLLQSCSTGNLPFDVNRFA